MRHRTHGLPLIVFGRRSGGHDGCIVIEWKFRAGCEVVSHPKFAVVVDLQRRIPKIYIDALANEIRRERTERPALNVDHAFLVNATRLSSLPCEEVRNLIDRRSSLTKDVVAVQPQGFPLAIMDGGHARGRWTLHVEDDQAGDTFTLNCWWVRITPRHPG